MNILLKPIFGIALNAGVLYVFTRIVEGVKYTGGYKFFIIGGIVLGIINLLVRPILKIFSLPFTIITGGLFIIVINIATLWIFKYFLGVMQFQDVTLTFPNLSGYFIGAIVFGLVNWGAHLIVK